MIKIYKDCDGNLVINKKELNYLLETDVAYSFANCEERAKMCNLKFIKAQDILTLLNNKFNNTRCRLEQWKLDRAKYLALYLKSFTENKNRELVCINC